MIWVGSTVLYADISSVFFNYSVKDFDWLIDWSGSRREGFLGIIQLGLDRFVNADILFKVCFFEHVFILASSNVPLDKGWVILVSWLHLGHHFLSMFFLIDESQLLHQVAFINVHCALIKGVILARKFCLLLSYLLFVLCFKSHQLQLLCYFLPLFWKIS